MLPESTYYISLMAFSLAGPLILSFDNKVHFWTTWKRVFISATLVAIPFLIWDWAFTLEGVWGFNHRYLLGIDLINLPFEEVLFFWVIPYAGLFIYSCLKAYIPNLSLPINSKPIIISLVLICFSIMLFADLNMYTQIVMLSVLISLTHAFVKLPHWFKYFILLVVFILLPFLLIDGILTGSLIQEPIVWYNSDHILGIRIFTIPIEDFFYNYTLLYWNVVLFESLLSFEIRTHNDR